MMKKRENGQALVDFLLLLIVVIGIPLGLLFRYNVQLRNASVRAVRGMGMAIRSWRGAPRRPAPRRRTAPSAPAEAKPATPAAKPAEKDKAPAAAPPAEAKTEAPSAAPAK